MVEEMLHLALVANVLTAVGGATPGPPRHPRLSRPPDLRGQGLHRPSFPINIAAFSPENMATFLEIEKPQPPAPAAALLIAKIQVPGLTIGDFYQQNRRSDRRTGRALAGRALHRRPQDPAGGGLLLGRRRRDHPGRRRNLRKGGAGPGDLPGRGGPGRRRGDRLWRNAGHGPLIRFKEIAVGRRYRPGDDPTREPTGATLEVDYAKVYPIKTNSTAKDYAPAPDWPR